MAKFARCGENMLINIDTISTIDFCPNSEMIILSIHTNDPKMLLLYKDTPWDRKSIRNFIDDIRSYFTLVEQAPCFWELLTDIEGIVFWKDGEPKCKIKRSDFGFAWLNNKK